MPRGGVSCSAAPPLKPPEGSAHEGIQSSEPAFVLNRCALRISSLCVEVLLARGTGGSPRRSNFVDSRGRNRAPGISGRWNRGLGPPRFLFDRDPWRQSSGTSADTGKSLPGEAAQPSFGSPPRRQDYCSILQKRRNASQVETSAKRREGRLSLSDTARSFVTAPSFSCTGQPRPAALRWISSGPLLVSRCDRAE